MLRMSARLKLTTMGYMPEIMSTYRFAGILRARRQDMNSDWFRYAARAHARSQTRIADVAFFLGCWLASPYSPQFQTNGMFSVDINEYARRGEFFTGKFAKIPGCRQPTFSAFACSIRPKKPLADSGASAFSKIFPVFASIAATACIRPFPESTISLRSCQEKGTSCPTSPSAPTSTDWHKLLHGTAFHWRKPSRSLSTSKHAPPVSSESRKRTPRFP